jgi:hypothetical protein
MDLGEGISRRSALAALGMVGAAALIPLKARGDYEECAYEDSDGAAITDEDVFNFALNLESLEAEYYLRGTTGRGMDLGDAGDNPGSVNGGTMVPWKNEDLHRILTEVAMNELAHVRFYRRVLGDMAVSRPEIDIAGGFAGAAKAAGLGDNFDPFASEMNFLLGGMLMEDVGVTAYNGAASVLKKTSSRQAASGILAVEAYHMGMARSWLYTMGAEARHAANAISDARDKVDGPADVDQGIEVSGSGIITGGGGENFVPTDGDAKAFTRTPQQVLNIVYLNPNKGVSGGGVFPRGMNGKIRTT